MSAATRILSGLILTSSLIIGSADAGSFRWFAVGRNPWFADVGEQLQALVDKNGHQTENHICVVGEAATGVLQAYVYWPQENKLILWVPNRNDSQAIVDSARYLDLTRDVVANGNVGTSTYLLSRATAKSKIAACQAYGTTYTVQRRASGSRG